MISKVEHRVLFVYESMIHGLSFSLALDVSFGNSWRFSDMLNEIKRLSFWYVNKDKRRREDFCFKMKDWIMICLLTDLWSSISLISDTGSLKYTVSGCPSAEEDWKLSLDKIINSTNLKKKHTKIFKKSWPNLTNLQVFGKSWVQSIDLSDIAQAISLLNRIQKREAFEITGCPPPLFHTQNILFRIKNCL